MSNRPVYKRRHPTAETSYNEKRPQIDFEKRRATTITTDAQDHDAGTGQNQVLGVSRRFQIRQRGRRYRSNDWRPRQQWKVRITHRPSLGSTGGTDGGDGLGRRACSHAETYPVQIPCRWDLVHFRIRRDAIRRHPLLVPERQRDQPTSYPGRHCAHIHTVERVEGDRQARRHEEGVRRRQILLASITARRGALWGV